MSHRLALCCCFGALVLFSDIQILGSDFTEIRELCQKWKDGEEPSLSALAERFLRETGARKWRDCSGKHTVDAELVDYVRTEDGNSWVKLLKHDGTEVRVPSEKLSSYCNAHLSSLDRLLARLMLRRASSLPLNEFNEQLEKIDASAFMKFKAICHHLKNSGVQSWERPASQFLEETGLQRWELRRTDLALTTRTVLAEWVDYLDVEEGKEVVFLERNDGFSVKIPVTHLGWESQARVKRLTSLAAQLTDQFGATIKAATETIQAAAERLDGEKLLEIHDNPEKYVGMAFTLTVWINGSTINEVKERSSEGVTLLDGYVLELLPGGHDPNTAQAIGNRFGLLLYKLNPFLSSKPLARQLKEILGSGVYRKLRITFTVRKATDSRGQPWYLASISTIQEPTP